jgi:enamine deaminase RidA (YjgF/YER057c/UK114 family)
VSGVLPVLYGDQQNRLGPRPPARFTFQAGARPFGAKIELQAVAARGS